MYATPLVALLGALAVAACSPASPPQQRPGHLRGHECAQGQAILNSTAPACLSTPGQPVPVVVSVVWAVDGEEHVDTVALGWTGQAVYVRLADPRCRTNAIWLDGADVQRR